MRLTLHRGLAPSPLCPGTARTFTPKSPRTDDSQSLVRWLHTGLFLTFVAGCGGAADDLSWVYADDHRRFVSPSQVTLRWNRRVTPDYEGPYQPMEHAVPTLDPGRDRVYVGTSAGDFYAMNSGGRVLYRYDAGGSVAAKAALDRDAGEVFVPTEQGSLHKLSASTGEALWTASAPGPIRQAPALDEERIYVVTDSDVVMAFARDTGESLWSYEREAPDGFSISSHAGLILLDDHVLTGLTDGTVVALNRRDGSIAWERDTSIDIEASEEGDLTFYDVDTTPVVVDGTVVVASFSAGIYRLDPESGTVAHRDPTRTGLVGITPAPGKRLVLSSADRGIVCIAEDGREVWVYRLQRGSPTPAVISGSQVLVGESRGSFIALDLDTGDELARFDAGQGFSAPPSVAGGFGFVLSNGGTLYSFSL